MANYMKDVAEELQIPLEQPFKLLNKSTIVKLTSQGVFEWRSFWNKWEFDPDLLQRLLIGNCEIGELLPRVGDIYYTVFGTSFTPVQKCLNVLGKGILLI